MQLDRISYQYADDSTAAYDLHRRLTVIDVHPAHRRALVEHLLAALWSESPGVHVEFTTGQGRTMVAFRPYGATARVIDLEDRSDRSDHYRGPAGELQLLLPLGIAPEQARATLLAGRDELGEVDPTEGWISRLLAHDPETLGDAAEELVHAERALRDATRAMRNAEVERGAAGATGPAPEVAPSGAEPQDPAPESEPHSPATSMVMPASPELAEAVSQVYLNRDRVTALERRHIRVRLATLFIGTAVPIAALIGLSTLGGEWSALIIAVAAAMAGVCLFFERRLDKAVDVEYQTLQAAGAASYEELDARLANTPLADPERREHLVAAARRYRDATGRWQQLAGDIPAPWVAAQRERLSDMAQLRAALQPIPLPAPNEAETCSAALLAGLIARSEAVRALGGGEALPLFLDDPLARLGWDEKVPVLEFLNRLAENQQLVLCTDDTEVLAWARLEAMAGNAAVLDVNPGRQMVANGDEAGVEPAIGDGARTSDSATEA